MSEHTAQISWKISGPNFRQGEYSREHTWTFDGGLSVPASPSPSVVPAPYSNPANLDPEEAFVASISSCHMLTFLHLASRRGFEVRRYEDRAVGRMTKDAAGVPWISSIVLCPRVEYGETAPDAQEEAELHERAHHECFISNSVKTEITVRAEAAANA